MCGFDSAQEIGSIQIKRTYHFAVGASCEDRDESREARRDEGGGKGGWGAPWTPTMANVLPSPATKIGGSDKVRVTDRGFTADSNWAQYEKRCSALERFPKETVPVLCKKWGK